MSILGKSLLFALGSFVVFSTLSITGTQVSLGLGLLIWIVKMLVERRWDVKGTKFDIPFLLLFIIAVAATITSPRPGESLFNLRKFLLIPILYLFANNLKDANRLFKITDIFVGTSAVVAVYGIVKFLMKRTLKVVATQSTSMTWGAMSMIFLLVTASLLLFGSQGKKRLLYGLALLPQLLGLLLSYVRGSYVGTFIGLMALSWLKNKKIIPFLLLLIALTFAVLPSSVAKRGMSIFDLSTPSTQVRLHQWRDSIKIFKDYPFLGLGWIDLGEIHRRYADPGADLQADEFTIGHFHNNFIMILMYFGTLGLLVFTWLIIQIIRTEYAILKGVTSQEKRLSAIACGCFAAFIGFLTNGMFDWTFGDDEIIMLVWFTVGLSLAIGQNLSENACQTSGNRGSKRDSPPFSENRSW